MISVCVCVPLCASIRLRAITQSKILFDRITITKSAIRVCGACMRQWISMGVKRLTERERKNERKTSKKRHTINKRSCCKRKIKHNTHCTTGSRTHNRLAVLIVDLSMCSMRSLETIYSDFGPPLSRLPWMRHTCFSHCLCSINCLNGVSISPPQAAGGGLFDGWGTRDLNAACSNSFELCSSGRQFVGIVLK